MSLVFGSHGAIAATVAVRWAEVIAVVLTAAAATTATAAVTPAAALAPAASEAPALVTCHAWWTGRDSQTWVAIGAKPDADHQMPDKA